MLDEADALSEVAASVGYGSENAFNRTFRRYFGEPPGFVIMRRNTARVMLRQSPTRPALLSNTAKLADALDLYIWVSDVMALAGELRGRGARIVSEPELEDGRREMLVHDLDGYLICFGEVANWPH